MTFRGLVVWTVLCAVVLTVVLTLIRESRLVSDYTYSPIQISIDSSQKIFVEGEAALFTAVAKEPFAIFCPGADALTPSQGEPPLGWQYDKYFVLHDAPIPTEIWCAVELGSEISAEVSPQPEGDLRVITDLRDDVQANITIVISIVAIVIWVVVALFSTRPPSDHW